MSSSASSASEGGERVIQGSRRPDGTFRKDIRVKAGYVPIEEQATFSSRGSQFRNGPGRVPGLIIDDVPQQPAVRAKGKSAKRNEAKRKKKEEEQLQQADGMLASQTADLRLNEGATESSHAEAGAESSHAGSHPSVHAQQTAASPEPVTVPSGQAAKADTPPAAASSSVADAPGGKAGDQSDLEKRLRGLRKKLRQVDSLQEKQAAGQLLTPEEHEKLKHAQQWHAEASDLESALQH